MMGLSSKALTMIAIGAAIMYVAITHAWLGVTITTSDNQTVKTPVKKS